MTWVDTLMQNKVYSLLLLQIRNPQLRTQNLATKQLVLLLRISVDLTDLALEGAEANWKHMY